MPTNTHVLSDRLFESQVADSIELLFRSIVSLACIDRDHLAARGGNFETLAALNTFSLVLNFAQNVYCAVRLACSTHSYLDGFGQSRAWKNVCLDSD
jgi:hypothetical protein